MQCQNCNTEDMVKGTVPMAAQRGETSILVSQDTCNALPICEFYILDESVKAWVEEVVNDCEKPSAEVVK